MLVSGLNHLDISFSGVETDNMALTSSGMFRCCFSQCHLEHKIVLYYWLELRQISIFISSNIVL